MSCSDEFGSTQYRPNLHSVCCWREQKHSTPLKTFKGRLIKGFAYEQQFPNGQLLAAIRAQLVSSLIGDDRHEEAKLKFRELAQMTDSAAPEVARAARVLAETSYELGDLQNSREVFNLLQTVSQNDADLAQSISGPRLDRTQGRKPRRIHDAF